MSHRITAEFSDQLAAASAVDKLLSRGVGRDRVATCLEEGLGDTPVATGTPTTVVPATDREGTASNKPDGKLATSRLPQYGTDPQRFGHTRVTVEAADDAMAIEVRDCLAGAGGRVQTHTDHASPEDGDTAGAAPSSSGERSDDEQRAIDASRGGAALR